MDSEIKTNSNSKDEICDKENPSEFNDNVGGIKTNSNDESIKLSNKDNNKQIESTPLEQPKDESSTFSTAFTISFEDDNNTSKKLSIKDSIRKFAPPKPHTIEKPRQTKNDQCQENSLASIESAPAGLSKHSSSHFDRKGYSNLSRASSRRSNSSRHSNISESAAFLIDKMLNCKDQQSNLDTDKEYASLDGSHMSFDRRRVGTPSKHGMKSSITSSSTMTKRIGDGGHNNELNDHPDDKSDNGTYIVGTDPESDAARKKIDELFGVVRAAEESVIAESQSMNRVLEMNMRKSRIFDKKPLSRERQEHINRLACRGSSVSRSSSSSRQDNVSSSVINNNNQLRQTRASSRHSRNSSCDRANKSHQSSRHRRSTSQTSRQSSNKDISDGETRSSHSSLHNDIEVNSLENPISTHPSMKFNRAFALRRARLGLGEPLTTNRLSSAQSFNSQDMDSINNLSSSHRRHQVNSMTYSRSNQSPSSFSRDDGGRFSLRMKNSAVPTRLNSANHLISSNKSPQYHGQTLLENYINKVPSSKQLGSSSINDYTSQQDSSKTSTKIPQSPYVSASTSLPYQSPGEIDTMSPSRYRLLLKANRLQQQERKANSSEQQQHHESDTDSFNNNRFNYSTNLDNFNDINSSYGFSESKAGSTTGGRKNSGLQLGALDSLVISAISCLSLKIRNSVCDVLVEQAKKLPIENETRLIVQEILPQLTANSSSSKSPTSIEEIDQSLYFDLAKTLKNLKKVEQMVEVINLISNQLPAANASTPLSSSSLSSNHNNSNNTKQSSQVTGIVRSSENLTNT